ncbi:hypothetical protein NPIL_456451 [Nephila pilipes]|uniref:Uncharacterized protein n=1 Tax=Nephila pilipes TaxID=299642 RepID=A0A8X6N273_NEPPI|nr:hypothetical protein NPIL_456451 [Nephila pilipes]
MPKNSGRAKFLPHLKNIRYGTTSVKHSSIVVQLGIRSFTIRGKCQQNGACALPFYATSQRGSSALTANAYGVVRQLLKANTNTISSLTALLKFVITNGVKAAMAVLKGHVLPCKMASMYGQRKFVLQWAGVFGSTKCCLVAGKKFTVKCKSGAGGTA